MKYSRLIEIMEPEAIQTALNKVGGLERALLLVNQAKLKYDRTLVENDKTVGERFFQERTFKLGKNASLNLHTLFTDMKADEILQELTKHLGSNQKESWIFLYTLSKANLITSSSKDRSEAFSIILRDHLDEINISYAQRNNLIKKQ